MSETDKEILEELKETFGNIISKRNGPVLGKKFKLTNKLMAAFFNLGEARNFEYQLKADEDFFTSTKLNILYARLCAYMEEPSPYKELAEIVMNIALVKLQEETGASNDIILYSANKVFQFLSSAQSVLISLSTELGASQLIRQTHLSEILDGLLHHGGDIKKMNINVSAMDMATTIEIIETWAYGVSGNFADCLEVNVYSVEQNLTTEIIGGEVNGKWIAFMKSEAGYYQLGEPMDEWVQQVIVTRANESVALWSFPILPEARIIERMRRDNAGQDNENEYKISSCAFDLLLAIVDKAEPSDVPDAYKKLSLLTEQFSLVAKDMADRIEYYALKDK